MNKYSTIIIGGSAGSYQVISEILKNLKKDFKIPIIVVMHRLKHVKEGFVETFSYQTSLNIVEPNDKDKISEGNVYIAPSNYHLYVELNDTFALSTEPMHLHCRPAIDYSFESASFAYKDRILGIILSGANKDGAIGAKYLKENGGTLIVQEPSEALVNTMPKGTIDIVKPDQVLTQQQIISLLNNLK